MAARILIRMPDYINLLELDLNWKLAMQRLSKDLRDDFWPDPIRLRDVLGSPKQILKRFEPILKEYRPRRGQSYGIPKANLTVRDSIQISGLDRLVYQALIDKLIPQIDPKLSSTVFSQASAEHHLSLCSSVLSSSGNCS